MSWATLTLSAETIKGYVPRSLYDRSTEAVKTDFITDDQLDRAKRDVVNALTREIAGEMQKIGTPAQFMDVLEGITALDDYLQDCLITAWAARYFIEQDMSPDKFELADRAKEDFRDAISALGGWVRNSDAIDETLDDNTTDGEDVRMNWPLWAI